MHVLLRKSNKDLKLMYGLNSATQADKNGKIKFFLVTKENLKVSKNIEFILFFNVPI